MKLIGKTKEEIIKLMSKYNLEESEDNYLVYSVKKFLFFKKKIYIEFNENGIANMIYTKS